MPKEMTIPLPDTHIEQELLKNIKLAMLPSGAFYGPMGLIAFYDKCHSSLKCENKHVIHIDEILGKRVLTYWEIWGIKGNSPLEQTE